MQAYKVLLLNMSKTSINIFMEKKKKHTGAPKLYKVVMNPHDDFYFKMARLGHSTRIICH